MADLERDYFAQQLSGKELFSLDGLLKHAADLNISLAELTRILGILFPELSELDPAMLEHILFIVKNDKIMRQFSIKDLVDSFYRVRSVLSALEINGMTPSSPASVLAANLKKLSLTALERAVAVSMVTAGLPSEFLTNAQNFDLLVDYLAGQGITGLSVEEVLMVLSGNYSGDLGILDANPDLKAIVNAKKAVNLVNLHDLYEKAMRSGKSDLASAYAEVLLRLGEKMLQYDQLVQGSFKGRANKWLAKTLELDPTLYYRVEMLRNKYDVQAQDQLAALEGLRVRVESFLQGGFGKGDRDAYREKIQGMIRSMQTLEFLVRDYNDPSKSKGRRDEILDYMVAGFVAHSSTRSDLRTEKGRAEFKKWLAKGNITIKVHWASEKPGLKKWIETFGFEDVPILTFGVDPEIMPKLREFNFFTETGLASATRPEETPRTDKISDEDLKTYAMANFERIGGSPDHIFAQSGYFFTAKGREGETIEHELTHLIDLMRREPRKHVAMEAVKAKAEERMARDHVAREEALKIELRLAAADREANRTLLEENETYSVQALLRKLQQSGQEYDDEYIENGPFFSYAMDAFDDLERTLKAEKWAEIRRGSDVLTKEQEGELEKELEEYKLRLKLKKKSPDARLAEIDEKVEALIAPVLLSYGLEERKNAMIQKMHQLRAAMRYLQTYLTPAQVLYIARTAVSLEDVIAFLTVDEISLQGEISELVNAKKSQLDQEIRGTDLDRAEPKSVSGVEEQREARDGKILQALARFQVRSPDVVVPSQEKVWMGFADLSDPIERDRFALGQLAYYDFNDAAKPRIVLNPMLQRLESDYLAQVIAYELGHHNRLGMTPEGLRDLAVELANGLGLSVEEGWFESIQQLTDQQQFWNLPRVMEELVSVLEAAKMAPELGLENEDTYKKWASAMMNPVAFRGAVVEDGVLEENADAAVLQMIRIVIGAARMPARDSNNNLIAQVHAVGKNAGPLVALGAKPTDLTPEQLTKFSSQAASIREHNVFAVRADDVPEMKDQIRILKELGYAVFIFDDAAIRTIYADPKIDVNTAVFRLVELAAILGKTQFSLLMKDYGIQPQVGGYFSVAACLTGVIKTLIADLVARESIAQAA
jgi:hypothetical protein